MTPSGSNSAKSSKASACATWPRSRPGIESRRSLRVRQRRRPAWPPGAGPASVQSHLASAPAVPSSDCDLDGHFMDKLDAAVDQMIKGSVRRLTYGEKVELGPAGPPKDQGASLMKAAPRLPLQLAEIRQQGPQAE
ncbi:unnamed protein product, partial [Effrenium voratum]